MAKRLALMALDAAVIAGSLWALFYTAAFLALKAGIIHG